MSIASIRASNASIFSSLTAPTAVFFGGTAGIGQAMAQSLASHTQGNANIIIVGRNAKAAQEIIDSFPRPSSSVKPVHEFVSCDASLMSNVASATEEVKKHLGEKKVDFLVLTTGYLTTAGREETKEGNGQENGGRILCEMEVCEGFTRLVERRGIQGGVCHGTGIWREHRCG